MKCKEQHVGILDHGQVGQTGEQESTLQGMELVDGRRFGPYDAREQRRFVRLRDIAPCGIHHRHLMAAGAERPDDLHRRRQGHVPLGRRPTSENGYPHGLPETREQ
jgi:hypothetical protein